MSFSSGKFGGVGQARRKLRDNANTSKLVSEIHEKYKSGEKLRGAKSQA